MNEPQIITLLPFRRPSIVTAEETRDAIVSRMSRIRADYAVKIDPDELRGVVRGYSSTEPGAPKPGDLHDWDKLVDGCLYFDTEAPRHEDEYVVAFDGGASWTNHEWVGDSTAAGLFVANAYAKGALVIASGLRTADEFRAAMATHHAARKSGGAK